MRRQCELAILGLQTVDMNRSVGRLRCDEFIEGIPRDTLDVVRVLGNLPDHLPCGVDISFHVVAWGSRVINQPFCAL